MAGVVNFPLLRTPCLRPGLVEVVLRMAQAFVEAELVGVHNAGREIGRGNGESGPRSARLLDPFPRCPSLGGLSSFILHPKGTPFPKGLLPRRVSFRRDAWEGAPSACACTLSGKPSTRVRSMRTFPCPPLQGYLQKEYPLVEGPLVEKASS